MRTAVTAPRAPTSIVRTGSLIARDPSDSRNRAIPRVSRIAPLYGVDFLRKTRGTEFPPVKTQCQSGMTIAVQVITARACSDRQPILCQRRVASGLHRLNAVIGHAAAAVYCQARMMSAARPCSGAPHVRATECARPPRFHNRQQVTNRILAVLAPGSLARRTVRIRRRMLIAVPVENPMRLAAR